MRVGKERRARNEESNRETIIGEIWKEMDVALISCSKTKKKSNQRVLFDQMI